MIVDASVLLVICLASFILWLWYSQIYSNPKFQEGGEL